MCIRDRAEEKKPAPKKADKKKGGIGQWFHDMKGEMKKIVWPTKETTIKNTGIVIGMCAVVGVFLLSLIHICTGGTRPAFAGKDKRFRIAKQFQIQYSMRRNYGKKHPQKIQKGTKGRCSAHAHHGH